MCECVPCVCTSVQELFYVCSYVGTNVCTIDVLSQCPFPLSSLPSSLSPSLPLSNQLAMDLVHKDKAYIRGSGQKLTIVRAGLGASATAVGGVTVGTQD